MDTLQKWALNSYILNLFSSDYGNALGLYKLILMNMENLGYLVCPVLNQSPFSLHIVFL